MTQDSGTDRATTELSGFIDRIRKEAFDDGRKTGRSELHAELRAFFEHFSDHFDEMFPLEPTAAKRTRPAAFSSQVPFGAITAAVKTALDELKLANPEGVDPHAVADYLFTQKGENFNASQTRQALRQLAMTGSARRVSRGRYLPTENAAEAEPTAPQEAEAAE